MQWFVGSESPSPRWKQVSHRKARDIEQQYQVYLAGEESKCTMKEVEFNFNSFRSLTKDHEKLLLRKRIATEVDRTQHVFVRSAWEDNHLKISLHSLPSPDCSDIITSVTYFWLERENLHSKVMSKPPYSFGVNQATCVLVTIKYDNLSFPVVYEVDTQTSPSKQQIFPHRNTNVRYIENIYNDHSNQSCETLKREIISLSRDYCSKILSELLPISEMEEPYVALSTGKRRRSYALYNGVGGFAYFFWKAGKSDLFSQKESKRFLDISSRILRICENNKREEAYPIGFLQGCSGIYALHSVVLQEKGLQSDCRNEMAKVISISETFEDMERFDDELMNGIAGYMASLLFIRKHVVAYDEETITKLLHHCFRALCRNGVVNFGFHGKEYYGAAHGLAGVLLVLLHVKELATSPEFQKIIESALSILLSLENNGAYAPTRKGVPANKELFQWCHGTAGIIGTLLKAYEIYGENKYKQAALAAGDALWQYGLLRKGFGLCHGICGNGYSFLQLYQAFNEEKYLYRAYQFFKASFDSRIILHTKSFDDPSRKLRGSPDHIHSLMEGLSGEGCFAIDIVNPLEAAFPGYYNDLR